MTGPIDEEGRLNSLGLRDPVPSNRQKNYIELLESSDPDKLDLLKNAIKLEKDTRVKKFVLDRIKSLNRARSNRNTSDIRKRIQLAFQSDDPKVHVRAVEYILKSQLIDAFGLIKHIAKLRNQNWLTINAIQLAAIQPGRFRDDLMEWMQDSQPEIRKQAFLALINHDALSSQAYAACLVLDESDEVSDFVLQTIKKMRPQARAAMLSRISNSNHEIYNKTFNYLENHLRNIGESNGHKIDTVDVKHILDDDFSIVAHFQRILDTSTDNYQLASTLLALGGISEDNQKVKKILISYLNHEDKRVRANALEGFVELCDSSDARQLIQCSYDDSNRVVANALIGLWKLGDNELHIEAGITRLLNRSDLPSFKSVCHVLEYIRDDNFADSIRLHLSRRDEGFTDTALYAEGLNLLHKLSRHSDIYAVALKNVQEFYLNDALDEDTLVVAESVDSVNASEKNDESDLMEDLMRQLGDNSVGKSVQEMEVSSPSRLSPFCDQCMKNSQSSKRTNETAYAINRLISFGKRFQGKSDKCKKCGSIVSTFWFCFLFPIVPLGSYKIIFSRTMRGEILAMRTTNFSFTQILINYALQIPLVFLIGILSNLETDGPSADVYLKMGKQFYMEKKYPAAMQYYKKAVDGGSFDGMYNLGKMYYSGQGIEINYYAALRLFRQCSGKKIPACDYMLGSMYVERLAGLSDIQRGLDLLFVAEKLNFGPASFYLYKLYSEGSEGIARNIDLALDHLGKGSQLNHPASLAFMARRLQDGDGVARDELKAEQYLDAAARYEDPWAMKYLAQQILSKNPGIHSLKRAFKMLDKVAELESTGESEFIKGKYLLEFLDQEREAWKLIDAARDKGWEAAVRFK
tara:strand:- start:391 stop:2973 length:2583 start_codon:yes stop_codon:yes gene_type:complete